MSASTVVDGSSVGGQSDRHGSEMDDVAMIAERVVTDDNNDVHHSRADKALSESER